MTNISDQIIALLEPAIGKSMAGASVKTNCKKMGISPEELDSKHLDEFIKNLTPGLNVFAGKEFAEKITGKIKEIK